MRTSFWLSEEDEWVIDVLHARVLRKEALGIKSSIGNELRTVLKSALLQEIRSTNENNNKIRGE